MNNDDLVELRNKVIQLYQIASLIESGNLDLEEGTKKLKDVSKYMMESIEAAIKTQYKSKKIYDPVYNLVYEPIEVNPESLSKLKDYLELLEIK